MRIVLPCRLGGGRLGPIAAVSWVGGKPFKATIRVAHATRCCRSSMHLSSQLFHCPTDEAVALKVSTLVRECRRDSFAALRNSRDVKPDLANGTGNRCGDLDSDGIKRVYASASVLPASLVGSRTMSGPTPSPVGATFATRHFTARVAVLMAPHSSGRMAHSAFRACTLQLVPTLPYPVVEEIAPPLMNHAARLPVLSIHRMSLVPSPL